MKRSVARALARPFSAIRRWLQRAWFTRLPLIPWYRAARARADRDRPKLRFYGQSPFIEAMEERSLPNDVFGTAAAPLGLTELALVGAQQTPAYVLAHGWSGSPHGRPVTAGTGHADPASNPPPTSLPRPPISLTSPTAQGDAGRGAAVGHADRGDPSAHGTRGEPFDDPVADPDPFADPLGRRGSRPGGGGGGAGSHRDAGGGGGGGGGGAPVSSQPPAGAPTPIATGSGSPGDDLWGAVNAAGGSGTSPTAPPPAGRSGPATPGGTAASAAGTAAPLALVSSSTSSGATAAPAVRAQPAWLRPALAGLGQSFEANVGQAPAGVNFVARGFGAAVSLSPQQLTLSLLTPSTPPTAARTRPASFTQTNLSLQMLGADPAAQATVGAPLIARSNYFTGAASAWRTDVAQYAQVTFRSVYRGVDVTYHADGAGRLEYDYTVAPRADPTQVRWRVQGAQSVALNAQGNLLLHTAVGDVTLAAPRTYQTAGAQTATVSASYLLNSDGSVGLAVGAYDTTRPLVIDPVVSYGALVSGTGDTYGYAVAVDGAGAAYVAGETASLTGTDRDAFVTKLAPDGSPLFTTYLGGAGFDSASGVAVDDAGDVYVSGQTTSSDFSTTSGAYKGSMQGASDDFVAKLDPTGSALLYSTLLDGSTNANNGSLPTAVAVDQYGHAYAVGTTQDSSTFPTTGSAFQQAWGGGTQQAFVVQLQADGKGAVYSSLLGGSGAASATGVAVDSSGAAYVVGNVTGSFPTTSGAYQTGAPGGQDGFVTKVNPAGTAKVYATYLGGTADDWVNAVAVDDAGHAFVTGQTKSSGATSPPAFPTTPGTYLSTYPSTPSSTAASAGFVTELNAAGSGLAFSTFLGGSANPDTAAGNAVALAGDGSVWVAGNTNATDFPVLNPTQTTYGGGTADGFLTHLSGDGSALLFSTLAGGNLADAINGVFVDPLGNAYTTGITYSSDFPSSHSNAYAAAFVQLYGTAPAPPAITGISAGTGWAPREAVTNNPNQKLNGTALLGATVTVTRADVGVVGTATADTVTGAWQFDYTATALPAGVTAFTATQTVSGVTSDPSAPFLVTVLLANPGLSLVVPARTTSRAPQIFIVADDPSVVPTGAAYSVDVDLNNNGSFGDAGETNVAHGTYSDGGVLVTLPLLSGPGTYPVQVHLTDAAGNTGTSAVATITVVSSGSAWTTTGQVLTSDPLDGLDFQQLGSVRLAHPLDLDRSPGTRQGGDPALVYNSRAVSVRPIVQATIQTDNALTTLPTTITATLTWDGTAQSLATFSTDGFKPGDVLTVAVQVANPVTTTKRYPWSLALSLNANPPITPPTVSGSTFVVVQDGSDATAGAGWSLAGVDRLVNIPQDVNGPAGQLRVYGGTGGWRFYSGTSSPYTSPANDNGTLTYDSASQTYTYTTPAGDAAAFTSMGYQTQWRSADGQEVLSYRYDSANHLTGVTAIDGALATLSYGGPLTLLSAIDTANGRVTLAYDPNNLTHLTQITNPDGGLHTFTYDGGHRLTGELFANTQNSWTYDAHGALHTFTWGAPTGPGTVTNSNTTVVVPAAEAGLDATAAANLKGATRATVTDGLQHTTTWELDGAGRALQQWAADGGRTQWTRDAGGRVVTATDPLNRTMTYTRDSAGYVLTRTNADGMTATYAYQTAFHALTAATDENGHTTSYTYDGSGHPLTQTNALNQTTTYGYLASGLLQTVTDPLGHTTTYGYDSARHLLTVTDPLNHTATYGYDSVTGNRTAVTDPLNHTTTTLYDAVSRVTATIDALNNRATYTYNGASLPLTSSDVLGRSTSTVYDNFQRGQAVKGIEAVGTPVQRNDLTTYDNAGQPVSVRNANGWTTAQQRDRVDRVSQSTDPAGNKARTGYDRAGQATAARDELGRVDRNSYNLRGWQTRATDALGNVTSYAYDAVGNRTAVTDPLNHTTTSLYDALNRPTVVIDALGNRTSTAFDAAGNVSTVTDALGRITAYGYDAADRRTAITQAVGTAVQRTLTTAYDAAGNVTALTDALNHTTTYGYDALNRRTTVTDALNHTTTTAYDAAGNVRAVTDPRGNTTTYGYDPLDRRSQVTDALTRTATAAYDGLDNAVARTDPRGDTEREGIDWLGRVAAVVDAVKAAARTVYDAASNVAASLDAVNNRTTQAVDPLNRATRVTDPVGDISTMLYDAASNQTVAVAPRGNRTTYSYDAVNRLTQTQDALGNLSTVLYDAVGNRTVAVDALGRRTTYSYDAVNRRTQTQDALGNFTTAVYDPADNVLATVDELGRRTTTAYDAANRATTTTDALLNVATMLYDEANHVTARIDARGNRTTYLYDQLNRVTETVDAAGNHRTVVYDAAGNRLATVDPRGNRTSYAYDADNRLTATTDALLGVTAAQYDGAGKPTVQIDALGRRTTLAYDAASRVTQTTDAAGGLTTALYDLAGNQTVMIDVRGNRTSYAYDPLNRLTQTTDALNGLSTVVLDAVGNRLATADPLNHRTSYAYDALNRLTQTTDALGNPSAVGYDAVGNQTLMIDARGTRTQYVYDALNRRTGTLQVTNASPLSGTATGGGSNSLTDSTQNWNGSLVGQYVAITAGTGAGQVALISGVASPTQLTVAGPWAVVPDTTSAYLILPALRVTTTAYDPAGNATLLTDPRGNRTSYAYDALNRLTQTQDALGGLSTVVFDAAGNQAATANARGFRTTYSYDALNRLTQTQDALNDLSTTVYDAVGNRLAAVDPRGDRTSYAYDVLNRVTQTTDALNDLSTAAYDAAGNPTLMTDARGDRTRSVYDALNRRTGTLQAAGPVTLSGTATAAGANTLTDSTQNWNSTLIGQYVAVTAGTGAGQVALIVGVTATQLTVAGPWAVVPDTTSAYVILSALRVTTTAYDPAGNATLMTDPRGNRTSYAYDALNRLTQTQDALGGLSTVVFDAVGNRLATADPLNHRTSYSYDALNQRTRTQDALGNFSTVQYDAAGNVTATIDFRGNTTTYDYDALNRRTQTTDAFHQVSTAAYDAVGNPTGARNARGYFTTYAYDPLNRRTQTTDALGHITSTAYDAAGNVTQQQDALGKATNYDYDALNRRTKVTAPDGGVATAVYDAVGNVTNSIDPLGHKATVVYDALDRKTLDIDPLSGTTTYSYDAVGNRTGLVDPAGNRSTFAFDALNRQTLETDPRGKSLTVAYDAAGRQTSATDRLGHRRDDSYDADNRRLNETWLTSGATTNLLSYSYDANGNQLTARDFNGAYTMAYDVLNRVTVVNEPFGLTLTYTYDAADNRVQVQDSKGGIATSIYDGADRLVSRQFSDGTTPLRLDFSYTVRDQQATLTRYSDLAGTQVVGTTAYSYDDVGRTTNILSTNRFGTAVANYTTTYDRAGRATTETDDGSTQTYTYDNTNQLTNDSVASYGYDANGNRTTYGYASGADNQLLSDPAGYTYSYDDEGNRTKKRLIIGGDTWSYGYDQRNQLTSVVERAADSPTATVLYSATYTYDVFNRRIESDVWTVGTGGTTVVTGVLVATRYGYDDSNVWADLDTSNALVTRYLRPDGTDALGARLSAVVGSVAWYVQDRQLSVKVLLDNSSVAQDKLVYDGFGRLLSETGALFGDRYTFTGREGDRNSKLQYNWNRYYDTATGGWLQQDPIRFGAGDTNLDRYVRNGPTNATDPSGLAPPAIINNKNLPQWIRDIPTENPGQIALYEWKRAGYTTESFDELQKQVGRRDGFLTYDDLVKLGRKGLLVQGATSPNSPGPGTGNPRVAQLGGDEKKLDNYETTFATLKKNLEKEGPTSRVENIIGTLKYHQKEASSRSKWVDWTQDAIRTQAERYIDQGGDSATIEEEATDLIKEGGSLKTKYNTIALVLGSYQNQDRVATDKVVDTLRQLFETERQESEWKRRTSGVQAGWHGAYGIDPDEAFIETWKKLKKEDIERAAVAIEYFGWLPTNVWLDLASLGMFGSGLSSIPSLHLGPTFGEAFLDEKPETDPQKQLESMIEQTGPIHLREMQRLIKAGIPKKNCFPAGTAVETISGPVPIEQVRAGTKVWSYDFGKGRWVTCGVEINHTAEYDGLFVTLTLDDGSILDVTEDHPFWVMEGQALDKRPQLKYRDAFEDSGQSLPGRWVHSHALQTGDRLYSRKGSVTLQRIVFRQDSLPVYNLAVCGLPYYAVGGLGILVHNTETRDALEKARKELQDLLAKKGPDGKPLKEPLSPLQRNKVSKELEKIEAKLAELDKAEGKTPTTETSKPQPKVPNPADNPKRIDLLPNQKTKEVLSLEVTQKDFEHMAKGHVQETFDPSQRYQGATLFTGTVNEYMELLKDTVKRKEVRDAVENARSEGLKRLNLPVKGGSRFPKQEFLLKINVEEMRIESFHVSGKPQYQQFVQWGMPKQ